MRVIALHILNSKNCNFVFKQICLFSVATTFIVFALRVFPRRPRGSQSGRVKRRDESFQIRAKEPLGTDIHDVFDMSLTEAGRLATDRNCFRCAVKDVTSFMIRS